MIEIKLLERGACETVCRENALEPVPGAKVYAAYDGAQDRAAAFCVFETEGRLGVIRLIVVREPDYGYLIDGLLRSSLNYMLLHGVTQAEVRCDVDIRLLRRLGFEEKDGVQNAAVGEAMFGGCGDGISG